ncbi:MAG: energy-coupling factor transporter transmembrane protein EcfT [Candidatus Lokiarchaeota archaeon]|nr:energy-coupling factor transporter transmembrane protein EcfT [Candidatus Lokiarchaeota archaeon]
MSGVKQKNDNLDFKKFTFAFFPGTSLMHKLNPISKLIFLILLTIISFTIESLILISCITIFSFLLALVSKISVMNLIRKLRFITLLLIISVILNIFFNAVPSKKEEILFYLFNLNFLPIRRIATYLALKAFFIVLTLFTSAIIFTNTTSMKDFVYSLIRLKIPYKFCFSFMIGVQYIPTIEAEVKTIALAQKARGFGLEKVNSLKRAYNLIFERLVTTLVAILRKGHTTSISMENRCFGLYKKRTNRIVVKFKLRDFVFIIISFLIFTLLLLYQLNLLPLPPIPSLYQILF